MPNGHVGLRIYDIKGTSLFTDGATAVEIGVQWDIAVDNSRRRYLSSVVVGWYGRFFD